MSYHDPHVPNITIDGRTLGRVELTDEALERADCVVILTDHSAYDFARIADKARLVVDTRDAIRRRDLPHVYHLERLAGVRHLRRIGAVRVFHDHLLVVLRRLHSATRWVIGRCCRTASSAHGSR